MSSSRCCCDQKGGCCEVAGARWRSRYCLELGQCTIFSSYCDCSGCPQGCDDCNTAGDYCCREFELDWCVRGPIFRYPPGVLNTQNDATCPPEETFGTYSLCPNPWTAPNWDLTEHGHSSDYESTSQKAGGTCTVCTAAGANYRVQYRCRFRLETVAGNDCTYFDDPQTLDCEDYNETYTVEGTARIQCVATETDGGCNANVTYTHTLTIEPCSSPAAGLPSPPTMVWVANLSKNVAPHDTGVWTLDQVSFSYSSPDGCTGVQTPAAEHGWCTDGAVCANYTNPCSDNAQQGCDGCGGGMELTMGAFTVSANYPCQDNPCTLT